MAMIISPVVAVAARSIGYCTAGLCAASWLILAHAANAQTVFNLKDPEFERGEIEFESLNSVDLGSVEHGEERSIHEIAIGLGVTDYWRLTGAVEIKNPQGEDAEIEAVNIENMFVLPLGAPDDGEVGFDGVDENNFILGIYAALEIATEGGLSEGGMRIGPAVRTEIGPTEFIGNLFVDVPFADDEDAGLSYQTQFLFPLNEWIGIGVENFGTFEGVFGGHGHDEHVMGPALIWEWELANGQVFEPKLGVLFGLNEETPDAILSFNLKYKIGRE